MQKTKIKFKHKKQKKLVTSVTIKKNVVTKLLTRIALQIALEDKLDGWFACGVCKFKKNKK